MSRKALFTTNLQLKKTTLRVLDRRGRKDLCKLATAKEQPIAGVLSEETIRPYGLVGCTESNPRPFDLVHRRVNNPPSGEPMRTARTTPRSAGSPPGGGQGAEPNLGCAP